MRAEFCGLIARWRLTQREVALVLCEEVGAGGAWIVLPATMTASVTQRMRLLLRFDRAVRDRFAAERDFAAWLRADNPPGSTPLQAMKSLRMLRALIAEAESRRCGDVPGHPSEEGQE